MSNVIQKQILEAEEQLRQAILASDLNAFDELLAPEFTFTDHRGRVLSKQDDLEAHRSGRVKINELGLSELVIRIHGDVAIVSVRVRPVGSYAGQPFEGDFRFTRVWARSSSGAWQVVAGHASAVT